MHLNFNNTITLTGLAAAAADVKAKTPRFITAHFGLRQLRIQIAYKTEQSGISSRVGARCAANRALVNINYLFQIFQTVNLTKFARLGVGTVQPISQRFI